MYSMYIHTCLSWQPAALPFLVSKFFLQEPVKEYLKSNITTFGGI